MRGKTVDVVVAAGQSRGCRQPRWRGRRQLHYDRHLSHRCHRHDRRRRCGDHLLPTHNCSNDETHYDEACSKFDFFNPYDPVLSWQLGTELNNLTQYSSAWHPGFSTAEAFAPWNFSQVVCLYPSILDPRAQPTAGGSSTSMVEHFVAYVRGATGLEGLAK